MLQKNTSAVINMTKDYFTIVLFIITIIIITMYLFLKSLPHSVKSTTIQIKL